ncbi:MiaB/RimO family radical SAM methylthiotransferase [Enterorhabdus mucosicola]|uniref:MiaB/RimO family radical SAM methylthiotransferase n=1 Tax=Adlercreutzia mucosicola TaxID=580026 RepID=A0A6N8JJU1_9ACTN|nr:MiaB/RimO family radical SAM methylthiotransferase [Adlercreutzia mucosicola]MVX59902.1 MiaB/RimO family radical SAM methylthiotransferase [Adlercreutzia mucosicola]
MRFSIVNLGCKVNQVESDAFEKLLGRASARYSAPEAADLIIVNTCTVTGEAEKKTRKSVRQALRANDHARVIVTGCASAIDPTFFAELGERVIVVPKAEMEAFLAELAADGSGFSGEGGAGLHHGHARIGIKVQDGCDNACTYCIVHVARGRATSRPAEAVVAEAVALAQSGVREIVLTGINLGSYDADGLDLADLCRRLLAETAELHAPGEPLCRFRIGSVEPMDVSMDLIGLLAEAGGRLCRHLHLPLQSGSSKVLREMGRPYDAEEYRQLVDYLRAMVPEIALTTDIIVGFPGETDEDFEDTCALARHVGFAKIHVFPYSRREGTPAAERSDQVPPGEKAARAARLRALTDELAAADRAARAGTVELALVETPEVATTESYHEMPVPAGAAIGSLVPVKIG